MLWIVNAIARFSVGSTVSDKTTAWASMLLGNDLLNWHRLQCAMLFIRHHTKQPADPELLQDWLAGRLILRALASRVVKCRVYGSNPISKPMRR